MKIKDKAIQSFSFLIMSAILSQFAHASTKPKIANTLPDNEMPHHRSDNITPYENEHDSKFKPIVAKISLNNAPNRISSTIIANPDKTRAFHWFLSTSDKNSYVAISNSSNMRNATKYYAKPQEVDSHYLERNQNGYFIYKKITTLDSGDLATDYFTDEGKTDYRWEPWSEAKNKNEKVSIGVIPTKEYIYQVKVDNLKPDTTYYYTVGNEKNRSAIGTFKTASEKNSAFKFIQYTDTQNAYWNEHKRNEAQFGADTIKQAQKIAPDSDFILHTGDIVEISEAEDEWVDLFKQSQNSFLKMSLVAVPGNHDEYGLNKKELFPHKFVEHFTLDRSGPIDGGVYYSFDYNSAHFVVLNTNDYKNAEKKALGKEQLKWIANDVANARKNGAKWVILAYHKPLFSKSYHSLEDSDVQNVRDDFMKLIDQLDIDVALQGHDHVYSRTKSLNYADKKDSFVNAKIDSQAQLSGSFNNRLIKSPSGTTFVIPNTGGTKAYDAVFDKPLEHIKKVRPKLNWLTQNQLEHYRSLFDIGFQPQKSERFENKHENYRDSSEQNFAVYEINDNKFIGKIYQVRGDLSKGEPRKVKIVDQFTIEK